MTCESLFQRGRIDVPPARAWSGLDIIESLTNELRLCDAALVGSPFQHLIVARFDANLFPNH